LGTTQTRIKAAKAAERVVMALRVISVLTETGEAAFPPCKVTGCGKQVNESN